MRTERGVEFFHAPIGTPITEDEYQELLRQRRLMRSVYDKGHPKRLEAERAIRQARKQRRNAGIADEEDEPKAHELEGSELTSTDVGTVAKITRQESAAQRRWYDEGYQALQQHLREGGIGTPTGDIAQLKSLISKAKPFTVPALLYRGTDGDDERLFGAIGEKIGQEVTEPGFFSTGSDRKTLTQFGRNYFGGRHGNVFVHVSPGARAFKLKDQLESEYLFPPKTRLRIDSDVLDPQSNTRTTHVTLLAPEESDIFDEIKRRNQELEEKWRAEDEENSRQAEAQAKLDKQRIRIGDALDYFQHHDPNYDPNGEVDRPLWHNLMSAIENANTSLEENRKSGWKLEGYPREEWDQKYIDFITGAYEDNVYDAEDFVDLSEAARRYREKDFGPLRGEAALAHVDKQSRSLLSHPDAAIVDYYNSMYGYRNINDRARGLTPPKIVFGKDQAKENIAALDRIFADALPLDRDIEVHRGLSDSRIILGSGGNLVGKTIGDPGFMSTTTSEEKARDYADGMLGAERDAVPAELHIRVPSGTKAISTEPFKTGGESAFGKTPRTIKEVLLHRGTSLKFDRDEIDSNGRRHLYAHVVPDDTPPEASDPEEYYRRQVAAGNIPSRTELAVKGPKGIAESVSVNISPFQIGSGQYLNEKTTAIRIRNVLTSQAKLVPSVVRDIRVSVTEKLVNSSAKGQFSYRDKHMEMHPTVFLASGARLLARMHAEKWWVPNREGTSLSSAVISHETGHGVAAAAFGRQRVPQDDEFWVDFAEAIRGMGVMMIAPPTPVDPQITGPTRYLNSDIDRWLEKYSGSIRNVLSIYGASNADEMLAELWAEYSTNDNPRPPAKIYGDYARKKVNS